MSIRSFVSSLFVIASLLPQNASAMPVGVPNSASNDSFDELTSTFLFGSGVDFTAIVALNNCSGSLVRFQSSLGMDQAMVLTNAHCLEDFFLPPGEVIVGAPSSRTFRLLKSDGKSAHGTLNATRILYATLTQTDMALYGLRETYNDIQKRYGVTALTLSASHPRAGRPITIPSGYWRRIYSCSIDRFVYQLREDKWAWSDSILYKQPGCATIGGTSGSPIIDSDTYEVIGVNNTGNENGERCEMNNPCEVDAEGRVTVTHKASYGQQTYWLYGCLNGQNEIALSQPGCQLPKPARGARR